jgi:hypothetical protein
MPDGREIKRLKILIGLVNRDRLSSTGLGDMVGGLAMSAWSRQILHLTAPVLVDSALLPSSESASDREQRHGNLRLQILATVAGAK